MKMAQLWGGRFTKETDKLVYNFNASISFDQKFYKQDIKGSMAHVKMLAKQGILTEEERDQILAGLEGILADVESGKLEITSEYEDIHSFVAALHLDLGQDAEILHQGDVLRLDEGGQSGRGVLLVGQAALCCFLFPLGSVAVAVEDDAAMVADGALDEGDVLVSSR